MNRGKTTSRKKPAPPSSFTNSNRTMASRSGAGQAPSAIPILILVSTRSSRAPTSSGWFLLQPSRDTTAGEESGPMGTMTMVKLVKRRRRVVSSMKNARISRICEFIELLALQLLFLAIFFGETSLDDTCPVRYDRRS